MLGTPTPKAFPSSALDARPIEAQPRSPLLALPAELRNKIYRLSFGSGVVIADPTHSTQKSKHQRIPVLNTSLLITCRQIYAEVDLRAIFSANRFRFTSATIARDFFLRLPEPQRLLVRDVELDLREVQEKYPGIARAWIQYLFWSGSQWSFDLGSLKHDTPNLRTLRINAEAWPKIAVKRGSLWEMLLQMLQFARGLDSIVIRGSGRGGWMEKQDPWSSVHYVGSDIAGRNDLVERMATAIGVPSETRNKTILWCREDGRLTLEVATREHGFQSCYNIPEMCSGLSPTTPLPKNGRCDLNVYLRRRGAEA